MFTQRVNLWQTNDEVRDLMLDPALGRVPTELAGVGGVRIWHDQALVKGPYANPTAFHLDVPYWSFTSADAITIWVALDDATLENGCLYYVPGSHKAQKFDNVGIGPSIGALFDVYPEWGDVAAQPCPVRAGGALFHNGLTFHGAGANMTPGRRRAMTCAVYAGWLPFNGTANVLPPDYLATLSVGDVLDNEAQNPLVYPRRSSILRNKLRQPRRERPDVTIRVAVVGAGHIGTTHARCYQADERAELVAVCDVVPEVARRAAEQFGVPGFSSVGELLASGLGIDAASVCSAGKENGADHYAPTMELLRSGIPVLGEKPISNRVEEAREMVALASEMGIAYGINLNHRFTPAARRARSWLEEGKVGEVNICNMTMWINNPNESSPHFHMRALHPHSIDVMRYFCGNVERVQAFFKKGPGRSTWSNVQANFLFSSGAARAPHGELRCRRLIRARDVRGSGERGQVRDLQRLRAPRFLPPAVDCDRGLRLFGGHEELPGDIRLADRGLAGRPGGQGPARQKWMAKRPTPWPLSL